MARNTGYGGANGNNSRTSRGRAVVDDDTRLGGCRGGDVRVSNFSSQWGKPRGSVERADRYRSEDRSLYATGTEKRRRGGDTPSWKVAKGADEAPVRGEGGSGRFRGNGSNKGKRAIRPAIYSDDEKSARESTYDTLNYDGGSGRQRDMEYIPVTNTSSGVRGAGRVGLPGFIFDCPRASIVDFSLHKGTFLLPFDDRRFAEQVIPTTKIFMFDSSTRELHGVFEAESSSIRVPPGPDRVRVRVAKECIPLTERQFKDILRDNYYAYNKFSENLTKDQVMKLLHTFRPVDPVHSAMAPLSSSRRTLESGLTNSSQEYHSHSISDEIGYRKEERRRRGAVENRALSGHSYNSQEPPRLSSKLPTQRSTKSLDEYVGYAVDEDLDDLPVSTSRFVTSPYATPRGKFQSVHGLSSSRASMGHLEVKHAEAIWGEDHESRDLLYGKRQAISPSPDDHLTRAGLSPSPSWKNVHSTVELTVDETYDGPGKGGYKEESAYMSRGRRGHSDVDLNAALEIGHGQPDHLHDLKSKGVRRRVWDDEEEKVYSLSPPNHRSLVRGSSSLQLPEEGLAPEVEDDYDDVLPLDSRHMVSSSRTDYPLSRTEGKSSPMSIRFSNGRHGKPHPRAVTMNPYSKDKPVGSAGIQKRIPPGRDSYSKEPSLRGKKGAVFKIKANLQAQPGRGKPERIVTMLDERVVTLMDKGNTRSQGSDGFGDGGSNSQGRKRKSVWSRISRPVNGPGLKERSNPHGRGRVFSRLGPNVNASSEPTEGKYAHKNKKVRQQHPEADVEDDSGMFDNVDHSPDVFEDGDYLTDDNEAEGSGKKTERVGEDLHSWTRKKASLVHSGEEFSNPGSGDFSSAKGGRRKLVRPPIGTKDQVNDGGWKRLARTDNNDVQDTRARLRSRAGSMDMDAVSLEALEAVNESPRGSRHDLNSLADDYHPDFEEDNAMSA